MTNWQEEEFNHLLDEFFGGVGSRIYQYCVYYKVKFHRKLRAKLKNGDELEYVDETGATVKLSEDDIYKINAIPSFRAYMQNELGTRLQFSLDITKYSREDFLRYLEGTYDPENPDKYDIKLASHSVLRRLSSLPRFMVKLQQSLMVIHGNIEVDQMAPIISSIGFGQLLSTPINYDHNLLRDLGGTNKLIGRV